MDVKRSAQNVDDFSVEKTHRNVTIVISIRCGKIFTKILNHNRQEIIFYD